MAQTELAQGKSIPLASGIAFQKCPNPLCGASFDVGEVKTADNILQIDEFLTLVEQVSEEGVLDATERALIYNLLEANDTEIVEVMTPRTQMAFLIGHKTLRTLP